MHRVLVLMLSVLIAGAVSCTGEPSVTTMRRSGTPSTEAVPALQPIPAPSPSAEVGDTVDLTGNLDGEGLAVTLVKLVDPAGAKNQYATPEAGTRFVAVQFRLKNTGTAVYKDSPSNGAKIVDTQGQQFSPSYNDTSAGPGFPGSVTVAPGDTGLGFLTFEVPKASKIAKVQFAMNSGFSSNTGQWTVP